MSRSAGFTLVEALIAILVLSIGLLGVAAMQMKALQSAHAGYQRSIASLAAQDAVELLWSGVTPDSNECPDISLVNTENWVARWENFLPELENPIFSLPDVDGDCVYEVTVKWEERRFGEEEDPPPAFMYIVRLPKGG